MKRESAPKLLKRRFIKKPSTFRFFLYEAKERERKKSKEEKLKALGFFMKRLFSNFGALSLFTVKLYIAQR